MREGRKKEASKVKQTNNKAKQHSTPKAVTFPKKNELPRVGLDTLDSRQSALPLSYHGSSAGWAQISHFIVHLMNRLTIKRNTLQGFPYPPSTFCIRVYITLQGFPRLCGTMASLISWFGQTLSELSLSTLCVG